MENLGTSKNYNLSFSIAQLNLIIGTLYSCAANKKYVGNVKKLFNMFAEESYKQDFEKEIRVFIIKRISDLIISKNLDTREQIESLLDLNGAYAEQIRAIIDGVTVNLLSEHMIAAADKMISNKLKSILIEERGEALIRLYNSFKTSDDSDFDYLLDEFEHATDNLSTTFKTVRESMDENRHTFSTSDGTFKSRLKSLIDYEANPSTKIRTGIKLFNNMLNGGFEKGRVYCALGLLKGWKSGLTYRALGL